MISIEEGSIGGFAAHVMQFLALEGEWAGCMAWRGLCRGRGRLGCCNRWYWRVGGAGGSLTGRHKCD